MFTQLVRGLSPLWVGTLLVGIALISTAWAQSPQTQATRSAPAARPAMAQADSTSQPMPSEELPTIQQGEDINVEDIPF